MKELFAKFKKDDFTKQSFFLLVALGVIGVLGLAYHLFMVRMLKPSVYGILNSLFAFYTLLIQPAHALYTISAKFHSEYFSVEEKGKTLHFILHIGKRIIIIGIVILLIMCFFSEDIAKFMQIDIPVLIIILGILIFLSLLPPVGYGMLAGYQRFTKLGIGIIAEHLLRFILAVLAVMLGFGIVGIFTSGLISQVIVLFILVAFISKILSGRFVPNLNNFLSLTKKNKEIKAAEFRKIYKYFFPAACLSFILAGIISIDVLLVKHFFSPQQAGLYSIAQIAGKIVLFLPMSFTLVMFSKAAASFAKGDETMIVLKKALLATMLIGGIMLTGVMLFPEVIIRLITGKFYPKGLLLIRLFALAMYLNTISVVMFYYNLAVERYKYLIFVIIFLLLEALLITFFHITLEGVLLIVNIIAFFILLSTSIYTYISNSRSVRIT